MSRGVFEKMVSKLKICWKLPRISGKTRTSVHVSHIALPKHISLSVEEVTSIQNMDISSKLDVGRFRASGGFADVYEGTMKSKDRRESNIKVAVKRIHTYASSDNNSSKVRK